jgi:hypothetical protein
VQTPQGEIGFVPFPGTQTVGQGRTPAAYDLGHDWPVMVLDPDGDGIGEPVTTYRKPATTALLSPNQHG